MKQIGMQIIMKNLLIAIPPIILTKFLQRMFFIEILHLIKV